MPLVIEYINGDGPAIGQYLESTSPATARTTDNTVTVAGSLDSRASESIMRRLMNTLNYARTSQDQLRVNVDSGSLGVGEVRVGSYGNLSIPLYGSGAGNSIDLREQLRAQYRANFLHVRTQKWSFT